MDRPLIVGAGLSGAVVARVLAEAGIASRVIDARHHVAGNCHTEIDGETNIMVHKYGPHIFHTDNADVWDFVNRFASFMPYTNRVKAVVKGRVYSMPVNLHTINQFFGRTMSPQEARDFIADKSEPIEAPANFEEQALSMIGRELYEAFFAGYTRKQWEVEPKDLPASILKRLPLRFTYDDNYFFHRFQGMPRDGYTAMTQNILDHELIEVRLGESFATGVEVGGAHVFYTGPIDAYFGFSAGKLGYRTLDFEVIRSEQDFLGTAVMNYCDAEVPWTRMTDHKYFSPWRLEETRGSLVFRETSRAWQDGDIRYYPLRLERDTPMLKTYAQMASQEKGVTFLGRLGTYRYLDMDVAISEALRVGAEAAAALGAGNVPRSTYVRMSS